MIQTFGDSSYGVKIIAVKVLARLLKDSGVLSIVNRIILNEPEQGSYVRPRRLS